MDTGLPALPWRSISWLSADVHVYLPAYDLRQEYPSEDMSHVSLAPVIPAQYSESADWSLAWLQQAFAILFNKHPCQNAGKAPSWKISVSSCHAFVVSAHESESRGNMPCLRHARIITSLESITREPCLYYS